MCWASIVSGSYPAAKRLVDLILSTVMLVISSPAWLLIALAIKLESRGPVFYKQRRWGRDGNQFDLYKFRSMKVVAGDAQVIPATVGDARVTRVGRFLRATGLDELPQLLNIWRGELSFVGPRALAVGETAEIEPGKRVAYEEIPTFTERLQVPPGLTGLATIYLNKDAPLREKLDYDLRYVRERGLLLDLKLIALSFWISIRGKWESRTPKV